MTVIIGMKANNKVYMGCDSVFLCGQQITRRSQSKLLIKDELLIGFTTSGSRILQVVNHKLKLPSTRKLKTEELEGYLATIFCSKLYKLLDMERLLVNDSDRKDSEPCMSPARLLIGIRDRLFEVGEDFDVSEIPTDYYAVGSGEPISLGCLEATTSLLPQFGPEDHLIFALKTVTKHIAAIQGPYQLANTGDLCLSTHL